MPLCVQNGTFAAKSLFVTSITHSALSGKFTPIERVIRDAELLAQRQRAARQHAFQTTTPSPQAALVQRSLHHSQRVSLEALRSSQRVGVIMRARMARDQFTVATSNPVNAASPTTPGNDTAQQLLINHPAPTPTRHTASSDRTQSQSSSHLVSPRDI